MEPNILISVIVPVYNVEAYLPRCVDSILAQTYANLEVILVDDGTKDNGGKICDDYAAKDPRVRVIHKENGGLSSARNAGIDIARGEYLGFVDSDDWIEPDMYAHMLSLALKYQVKLVCAGRFDVSEETGERVKGLCPPREEVISGTELVRRIFLWDNIDSAAWDKLYHRSLFQIIRYPYGKICEDIPTTYRIALDAGQAAMSDQPFYNYLCRKGSITNTAVNEKSFHYSQHAAWVYAHICREYPVLEPEARYLLVRSRVRNVVLLELAGGEAKERFSEVYRSAKKELGKQLPFILTSRFFTGKERVEDTLMALGLYGPFRKLYHCLEGRN